MRFFTRPVLATALAFSLQACTEDPSASFEPASAEPSTTEDIQKADGFQAELQGTGTVYHVSTKGSDGNPGTQAKPFRTVQKAAGVVKSGDTILVHGGTYGGVEIRRSGSATAPIRLTSAGDGTVTLQKRMSNPSCTSREFARDRTIKIVNGTDHWIIDRLTILGGISIEGGNLKRLSKSMFTNRRLPGRGGYDPNGAKRLLESLGVDGADGIRIFNNKIRGRGIRTTAARYGRIEGNEISYIPCAIGPAVWINAFSDFWSVRNNYIHDLAESSVHYLSEGIRLGRASMYNTLASNSVVDVQGLGRGVATDVNAGWNLIERNRAVRTFIAFSEQLGGWGNRWNYNTSYGSRRVGYAVYMQGAKDTSPTDETPAYVKMQCNLSSNDQLALLIGGAKQSAWKGNRFNTVKLGKGLPKYWTRVNDTWNGSTKTPSSSPPVSTAGC